MTALGPTRCVLAALPDHPRLIDTVSFQLTGLLVVFIALGTIWALVECIGLVFRRISPAIPTVPAPVTRMIITPATYAVIAAAVHTTFPGRMKIISIVPESPDPYWAREGRRQIFSSHAVRTPRHP